MEVTATFQFNEVGRLPLPGDNVAIAVQRLAAGTKIRYEDQSLTLDYTLLEGHRFAIKSIAAGEELLSWELPFGVAVQPIAAGQYVVNSTVLAALQDRSLDFELPPHPNFEEQSITYTVDETTFQSAPALTPYADTRTFEGYRRSANRGVGTRNLIVLLGTTSRTGSFVKKLAAGLQEELKHFANVDGIVPVAHTEGGAEQPNNIELLLRTLAGFIVNPNVGAVLVVDYATEQVTNKMLETYMREHNYPLRDVTHRFLSLSGSFEEHLRQGTKIVQDWLPSVNAIERTSESIRHLKVALQCGGSDAFSGISANPLLGWIAQELIRYGGAANLAETDELIGAEPYVLQKVRDLATANKFLQMIANFKERTSWHGASAEGNPSGGNKYRGLYNIVLKSIGAARKKAPTTRLDYAIDYGERMQDTGYHFMDSPGNDLESIAGQVASGCNLIFFTTGNGSITNFPFVPTIKVVTTSRRFELLSEDMDVNAGRYQEGVSMDEIGQDTLDLTLKIASGQRSVGEKAGHAQVQIWRNWKQTDASQVEAMQHLAVPTGEPIAIKTDAATNPIRFNFKGYHGQLASDQIGLILPTSLCSGQVANAIASRLNQTEFPQADSPTRFVALAHTEGCGSSGGDTDEMYIRTMIGYLTHPLVKHCLLLEHGCEKTHNDFMRQQITEAGGNPEHLGFASIQMDGGIDKVTHKVEAWFANQIAMSEPSTRESVGLEALRVGVISDGPVTPNAATQLALLTKMIVDAGGVVVVPENCTLVSSTHQTSTDFAKGLQLPFPIKASLAYGEPSQKVGFHLMATPTDHWVETVTGLAATGVELIIALVHERPMQSHPFVPMLQVATDQALHQAIANDLDILLAGNPAAWPEQILQRCKQVIEHEYTPRLFEQGNVDFQFTRGLFGVSL